MGAALPQIPLARLGVGCEPGVVAELNGNGRQSNINFGQMAEFPPNLFCQNSNCDVEAIFTGLSADGGRCVAAGRGGRRVHEERSRTQKRRRINTHTLSTAAHPSRPLSAFPAV